MSLRLFKRIGLGPFARINVSSTGLSLSIGPRGFSFSIPLGRQRQPTMSVNLPGPLSWRKRLPKAPEE